MPELTIMYRGPLSSCNYACEYCPFAKRRDTRAQLAHDRECLERLLRWAWTNRDWSLRFFFTPWGEALVQRYYREALAELCSLPHVQKVVAQTNLSAPLGWTAWCHGKLALWATYHPEQATHDRFLAQCRKLSSFGVPYSVGSVGFPHLRPQLEAMRAALPDSIYFWVNAVKSLSPLPDFSDLDPLYTWNTRAWPSRGQSCGAGSRIVSVDGHGDMRTCHFQPRVLGNLYDPGWEAALGPRACETDTCRCHIGYAHLDYLELDKVYGSGILERIPSQVSMSP